jgi:hypothetical protein
MSPSTAERPALVYKVEGQDGRRYIVYNAAAIGNPADHRPHKWYVRPYSVAVPLGAEVGGPFETAEEAERSVRARHGRVERTARHIRSLDQ